MIWREIFMLVNFCNTHSRPLIIGTKGVMNWVIYNHASSPQIAGAIGGVICLFVIISKVYQF